MKKENINISKQEEVEILTKRLKHLLKTNTIKYFDEKNPYTNDYLLDITELDNYINKYLDLLTNDLNLYLLTGYTSLEIINLMRNGYTISFGCLDPKGLVEKNL